MRLLIAIIALIWFGGPAWASPEPIREPTWDWVERVELPAPNPALSDRPVQNLLVSSQSLYGSDHHDHYAELAFLVQNMQGLQGLGNISLPWQPDHSDLIVHKVRIIRNGTIIDLLAGGQDFTVLRRENNLESAVLDGVLTAVMQAEGLMVGDILDIAFTVRLRAGALPLRGENFFAAMHGAPVRRFHVRQIWPESRPMRWRGTGMMERARTRRTALGTELFLDVTDAEGPQPPANAPPRYALPATLQITEFRDWSEISTLMAPLYERAQALQPASPLLARIERIAATTADPRARAMAALRLVQDEIRYLALAIGDGNFVPATADETWTRRYGDCKGKTATLLALLRGLGVEAEPVLVNSAVGDSLDERLPQLGLFDHVVVRARIGGRSYWLDGTRSGDRNLDDLASSPLGWGLPVRAAGAQIEALPYAPPSLPIAEENVVYDASGGFDAPIPFRLERIFRGDAATSIRAGISQIGRDEFLRRIRESDAELPGDGEEVAAVDLRDDDAGGSVTIIASGTTRMSWRIEPGAGAYRFRFSNATIAWPIDLDRPEGPLEDAPFAFPVPVYFAATETIILPNEGRGYALDGSSFERIVAGTRIGRQLSLTGNRATARSVFQRIEREVPAREARASLPTIRSLEDDEAFLRAPSGMVFRTGPAERPSAGSGTAQDLVQSGYEKLGGGQVRGALDDFDRAIALAPDWARAHANRAIALIHLDRLDEAEAALAVAMRRDQEDFVVHQGYGYLHLRQDRPEDAIRSLGRSLELDPDNGFTLGLRAEAHQRLGRLEPMLADLTRAAEVNPGSSGARHMDRARALAMLGREAEALAAADAAVAAEPRNFGLPVGRGEVLDQVGRPAEAADSYRAGLRQLEAWLAASAPEEAAGHLRMRVLLLARLGRSADSIALVDAQLRRFAGNTRMLALRCQARAEANVELRRALADCNEALEAEPGHEEALFARGLAFLRMERWADAERDFTSLLEVQPRNPDALYGRGLARQHIAQSDGATGDVAAARRYLFYIDSEFDRRGLRLASPAGAAASPQ